MQSLEENRASRIDRKNWKNLAEFQTEKLHQDQSFKATNLLRRTLIGSLCEVFLGLVRSHRHLRNVGVTKGNLMTY